jgi:hypothetical protein
METNRDVEPGGRKHRKVSALVAASIGRSATAQVRRHIHASFDQTGTNVSYEGATAPGAGGSVGTGYASGQAALDEHIRTNPDFVQRPSHAKAANKETPSDDQCEDIIQPS